MKLWRPNRFANNHNNNIYMSRLPYFVAWTCKWKQIVFVLLLTMRYFSNTKTEAIFE